MFENEGENRCLRAWHLRKILWADRQTVPLGEPTSAMALDSEYDMRNIRGFVHIWRSTSEWFPSLSLDEAPGGLMILDAQKTSGMKEEISS